MREVDQAGVLEYQRRQQGMTLLATVFSSLRLYRRREGRLLLDHILKDLSDGRLIRIAGPEGAEYVPLTKPPAFDVKYDVIVDDAPTSPNQREMVWSFFGQRMADYPPNIQAEIIKYSPLPASVSEKIAGLMLPAPSPEQEQAEGMDLAAQQAEVLKTQTEAQENLTQAYKSWLETLEIARMTGMPAPPELPQPMLKPMAPPQAPQQSPQPPGPPPGMAGPPGMGPPPGPPQPPMGPPPNGRGF